MAKIGQPSPQAYPNPYGAMLYRIPRLRGGADAPAPLKPTSASKQTRRHRPIMMRAGILTPAASSPPSHRAPWQVETKPSSIARDFTTFV